jgi:hypothetical protein
MTNRRHLDPLDVLAELVTNVACLIPSIELAAEHYKAPEILAIAEELRAVLAVPATLTGHTDGAGR